MDRADEASAADAMRSESQMRVPAAVALPDYHVHTCWSDGCGSVAELIAAAAALPELASPTTLWRLGLGTACHPSSWPSM